MKEENKDYVHSAERTCPIQHSKMQKANENMKYQAFVKNAKTNFLKQWRCYDGFKNQTR